MAEVLLKHQILNQIRHYLRGYNQIWHYFFYQNILKSFNDFQNQHFSILWLKWAQTMEMKQNEIFFHEIYSNLSSYIYIYMTSDWKSFNGFQNWHFSVLWLKWTQTVGMKQNQTFFHWTYSNQIFFITGWKILKYFNDLDLSISLQKWVETSYQQIPAGQQIQTGHVQIRQYFWPFAK